MRSLARLCATAVLSAIAGEAAAHGAFKGIGSFYGGVLHPVVVPAHLISLLAIGIFVGQRGWDYTVRALPVFIVTCIAGLALAQAAVEPVAQVALLSGAAIAGALVAADARVPTVLVMMLMVMVGFVISLDSAPGELPGGERFAALAGTCIGLCAGFIWVSGPVTCLARPWQRIGIRVVGSWVCASALLVLALVATGRSPIGG